MILYSFVRRLERDIILIACVRIQNELGQQKWLATRVPWMNAPDGFRWVNRFADGFFGPPATDIRTDYPNRYIMPTGVVTPRINERN